MKERRPVATAAAAAAVAAVALLAVAALPARAAAPQAIRVMTYNLLCSVCGDVQPKQFDGWKTRLDDFKDIFERHRPDLLGTQELMVEGQVEEIKKILPQHDALYFHHDGLYPPWPDAAVFYNRSMFQPAESGQYWLSPTPSRPFSTGFANHGAQIPRLVSWVLFERLSDGLHFFFTSTHFDNNAPSQEKSAPLLLNRTHPYAEQYPSINVGDFNSDANSTAFHILTRTEPYHFTDSWTYASQRRMVTNMSPAPQWRWSSMIDHIFVSGVAPPGGWPSAVPDWVVDYYQYGGKYPSDHRPVQAVIML